MKCIAHSPQLLIISLSYLFEKKVPFVGLDKLSFGNFNFFIDIFVGICKNFTRDILLQDESNEK